MGLNRMMFVKRSASSSGGGEPGDNMFLMTMGQQGGQYGYSRYNANIGEVEGEVYHDGKAVTLVMTCYYGGWLDVAFKVDGVTSGSYNVDLNITPLETGVTTNVKVGKISYISSMFSAANVGKKFKIEIVFN
jgi:hypothetical protein